MTLMGLWTCKDRSRGKFSGVNWNALHDLKGWFKKKIFRSGGTMVKSGETWRWCRLGVAVACGKFCLKIRGKLWYAYWCYHDTNMPFLLLTFSKICYSHKLAIFAPSLLM